MKSTTCSTVLLPGKSRFIFNRFDFRITIGQVHGFHVMCFDIHAGNIISVGIVLDQNVPASVEEKHWSVGERRIVLRFFDGVTFENEVPDTPGVKDRRVEMFENIVLDSNLPVIRGIIDALRPERRRDRNNRFTPFRTGRETVLENIVTIVKSVHPPDSNQKLVSPSIRIPRARCRLRILQLRISSSIVYVLFSMASFSLIV